MSLYALLVRLLRFINALYFVEVRALGRENVPAEGPVILAANHPGSILDTILISTHIPRKIRYLARSGLFRVPVVATLFRQLGAIPVFRSHETTDAERRNVDVFRKVFELLEEGGCVGIFPEGQNSPAGQVAPLRTGAARMALGTEARNEYRLGLKVVPVGITFESRELLTGAVLIRFGEPIAVADYAKLHKNDAQQGVQQLTRDLEEALRREVVHIQDMSAGQLAEDLSLVLGEDVSERTRNRESEPPSQRGRPSRLRRWIRTVASWYRQSTPEASQAFEDRVRSRKYIHDVVQRAGEEVPERLRELRRRVDRFKDHLRQVQLRSDLSRSFEEPVRERLLRLRMTLYAVGMAPIVLFGFIHNVVPYLFTKLTARLFENEAVRGFAYFCLGVISFGLTFTAIGYWLWAYAGWRIWWVLLYIAALPPTGFAVLTYRRNITRYRDQILVRTLIWREADLVALLREERAVIARQFEELEAKLAG